MKQSLTLTIASLLTLLLATIHIADDIVRGMSPGGVLNVVGILASVIWLYGTVVLAGRRSGYIITLIFSLLMTGIPYIHMRGAGIGFGTNRSNGLVFVWTLFALGVTGLFSAILSARGLWELRRGRSS
jgi:hypothetical protein